MSKSLVGIVNKIVDNRTVVVVVVNRVPHPVYKKIVKVSKKYLVDKEASHLLGISDNVEIKMTRPISKRKTWKIVTEN